MLRLRLYLLSTAAALFAAAVLLAPAPAQAETYHTCKGYIDSVPATINQQGVWCLRQDLSTSIASGNAITIDAHNVTIDCNGFKLGGLGAGAGSTTVGIYANNRFNATMRNCSVRGFYYGINFTGGGGHLIEDNSYDSNTYMAIRVYSPGSTVRGNQVIDTGGSTVATASAHGIYGVSGIDIIDNTVNGVAAIGANANAYGIFTGANGGASITANRVRGLAANGTGSTYGIYNDNSGRLVLRDNDVQGSGAAGSVGVRCTNNQATARDNVVSGFETGILNCLSSGNTVNTN
ncbi:NosD domain-containing protein [Luteimonas salinilitoris]|uniref:NosD domain-containing protein n=1 Tax=Luteimonas salinilitoris TaxID=3237697 RepID=A0ABV4HLN7_9GAMM